MAMFDKPWRNHPLIILEKCLSIVWVFIIIALGDITAMFTPDYWRNIAAYLREGQITALFSSIGGLIVLAVCLFIFFRQWSRTFFRIENGMLIVEKKTIFKKSSKLPIENIATVNLESNIIEQLLKTSKVKIDLNSSVSADATDFTFVLKTEQAEQFKALITKMKTASQDEGREDPCETQGVRENIIFFTEGKLAKSAFFGVSLIAAAFTCFFFCSPFLEGSSSKIWFLPLAAILMIVFYASAIVRYIVVNHNFKLDKDDENIYLTRGSLKKRNYVFARDRVKAVIIKQSFIARILGFYMLEASVIGLGNENNETPAICLYVKKTELERVLTQCLSEFVCTAKIIKPDLKGFIYVLFAALIIPLVSLPIFAVFGGWLIIIPLAFTALALLLSYMSFRAKAISYNENVFSFSTGIFGRKTSILRYADIRTVEIRTNVWLKKYDVGTMNLSIQSSAKFRNFYTGYFKTGYFEDCSNRVNLIGGD